MEAYKIDSNTWRFEDDFVRFFLLEGEEKAILIDSGVNCPNALSIAQAYTGKPIMLLNTHGDGDHTSGTGSFSEIYMHPLDYTGCEVCTRYPDTVLVEIKDGDVIELGNRPLEILHIPGHTKGSVAILDVSKRVLYAGDSVQKGIIYMFGEKRDPALFESALDKIIGRKGDFDQIYASHDDFALPKDYVEKVKQAWQKVYKGEVEHEMFNLFGNQVKYFQTETCGFYMD